ncbi:MAG: methylenetetrahydrofolate reductase [SAR324 cluster bacterium]|nr:methylenetetrahydrofolate reductase [SAR324 cluster bacterium]
MILSRGRFPSRAIRFSIPGTLQAKLESFADDPGALKEIGWNHLEAQTESLLREGIEGVHLYALNRLETVRRFSQLIQPLSDRHDTYSENLEKNSIAENSKIPITA